MDNNTSSENNYENFDIETVEELKSYKCLNNICSLSVLKDGRIATFQSYEDETGAFFHKFCVYSVNHIFKCDISIDYDFGLPYYLEDDEKVLYEMKDGNAIVYGPKIIKINKNNIEQIWI